MNDINNLFKTHMNNIDKDIINLFSIRKKYKTNSSIYKHPALANINISMKNNNNMSLLDYNIYQFEFNNHKSTYKSYQKLFNPLLVKKKIGQIIDLDDLNLNSIIKQTYLFILYDICEYGNDENIDLQKIIDLDIEILYKLSERIHFGYETIKQLYINNKLYFENNILNNKNTQDIISHLYDYSEQPTYLDEIKFLCDLHDIDSTAICTLFKLFIIPYYLQIQLHFLYKLINI